ncbi:hypothetical protein PAXRUDRAFT_144976, partial [Paxillus rubicundulus Ve08.2h10]
SENDTSQHSLCSNISQRSEDKNASKRAHCTFQEEAELIEFFVKHKASSANNNFKNHVFNKAALHLMEKIPLSTVLPKGMLAQRPVPPVVQSG